MNKEERRNRIIQLIEESDNQQIFGTGKLAQHLGVSEMTIRRDLQELSQEGLLLRQHGGARPMRRQPEAQRRGVGILLISRGKYSDPFFNAVLEGVDVKLQELGYRIAYINTHAEINTAAQAHKLFQSTAVDGLIMVGPALATEPFEYLKANMRVLVVTAGSIGPDYDAVTMDGYNGIRQIVDHLFGRGYRRLGFITGNYDFRQEGYIDALAAHGLVFDRELCVTVPFGIEGWTPQLGHIGTQQLMQLNKPPDAILCAS